MGCMFVCAAAVLVAWEARAEDAEPPEEPTEATGNEWRGYVLPLFGANSTDGVGLGLGGELFERPADQEHGYRFKLTASSWLTVSLQYTSQFAQAEWRTDTHWLLRGGYQTWGSLPYAGVGGADVSTNWGEREIGGRLRAPYALAAASHPLIGDDVRGYGQITFRQATVFPLAGSLLAERDPFGAEGGWYGDFTAGLELDRTDRWPMPVEGTKAEIDARLGVTHTEGRAFPLFGAHAELIRWWPLAGERLVLGTRIVGEKSFGPRPLFEQFVTGGRWRDELGYEQALTGYGRIRTRGDGVVAGLVELRPYLAGWSGKVITLDLYLSVFAEQGWLFDGADPGPPLPTLGFGPDLLFQQGSQLRPFLAWGWQSPAPGEARAPSMEFGLSLTDPL